MNVNITPTATFDDLVKGLNGMQDILREFKELQTRTMKERMWDVARVALYLGRTKASIYAMVANNEFPPIIIKHFGDRIFFDSLELIKWVDAQR